MHNTSSSETVLFVLCAITRRYHNAIAMSEGNMATKSHKNHVASPIGITRHTITVAVQEVDAEGEEGEKKWCQRQMFCVNSFGSFECLRRISIDALLQNQFLFVFGQFWRCISHSRVHAKLGIRRQFINMWNECPENVGERRDRDENLWTHRRNHRWWKNKNIFNV